VTYEQDLPWTGSRSTERVEFPRTPQRLRIGDASLSVVRRMASGSQDLDELSQILGSSKGAVPDRLRKLEWDA
jgi:hypothetical protein